MKGILKGLGAIIIFIGGLALGGMTTSPQSPVKPAKDVPGKKITQVVSSPAIYSKGTKSVLLEGVTIPTPDPYTEGPFFIRDLDLDLGQTTDFHLADVHVSINVRTNIIRLRFPQAVNTTSNSYQSCQSQLAVGHSETYVEVKQYPGNYVCVETDEGRVAVFRIVSLEKRRIGVLGGATDRYNVEFRYEYQTWKWD